MKDCLISIIVPTRRPAELKNLLETLKNNTADCKNIELIIKIDEDQASLYQDIMKQIDNYPFKTQWVSSPRLYGYYTMWINNQLTLKYVSPNAYFVLLMTDEAKFKKDWDSVVRKYYKYFDDDIFRLKVSHARYLNYYNVGQLNYLPDSFCFITKKWLDLTNGYGDCWGSDVFLQSISYHLGRGIGSFYSPYIKAPISRDIPVNENILDDLEIFGDATESRFNSLCKSSIMYDEWSRNVSHKTQTLHCYYARLTYLHIKAHEAKINSYKIYQDEKSKTLVLYDVDNDKVITKVNYKIPKLYFTIHRIYFSLLELRTLMALSSKEVLPFFYYLRQLLRLRKAYKIFPYYVVPFLGSIYKKFKPLFYVPRKCIEFIMKKINSTKKGQVQIVEDKNKDILGKVVIFDAKNDIKPIPVITLNAGNLYYVNNGQILPSKFFKKIISSYHYTSCSDEEFTHNLNKVFETGYKTDI
ncbi:MAG: hypothetical protein J0H68_05965 [Sphingobacteriia bacterium]|nr:hypothetical protein [Sphingobacteriia bacterium]